MQAYISVYFNIFNIEYICTATKDGTISCFVAFFRPVLLANDEWCDFHWFSVYVHSGNIL